MMRQKQGFTVLEIVLMLVGSGLILMGIFIAVPNMQANQRDSDRKSNVNKVVSAIKNYQTNNSRGALPNDSYYPSTFSVKSARSSSPSSGTWRDFAKNYLGSDFSDSDPNSRDHWLYILECGVDNSGDVCDGNESGFDLINNPYNNYVGNADGNIYIILYATCEGVNTAIKSNSNRSVAVVQVLERGNAAYCANT